MADTRVEISPVVLSERTKESKEPMNEALKNIHNLIHIRDSEILDVALTDWESSEQAYRKRIHRIKRYSGIPETRLLR